MSVSHIYRFSLVALCCWVLLPVCSLAESIKQIKVEGTVYSKPSDVLNAVKTKVGEDIRKPSTRWKIREDILAIWNLGHYSDVVASDEQNADGVDLVFIVQEKPQISDIQYHGNQKFKKKKLDKEIGFDPKKKAFFDDALAKKYLEKLEGYYSEQSYPNTTITWKAEDNKEKNSTVLIFEIQEGDRLPVNNIEFRGNTVLKEKDLRKVIQTKKSWWIIVKHHYDEAMAKDDCERIRMAYWDHGYLDAKAIAEPAEKNGDGLKVIFSIDEGKPYSLGDVTVQGNSIFSSDELLKKLTLEPGDRFSAGTMRKNEIDMLDLYRAQGFLDTHFPVLDNQLKKDPVNRVVDVNIPITEADRKYLGKVEIQGVVVMDDGTIQPVKGKEFKTKDYVIKREISLKPGEPIDWTQVIESDRELVNTNFFKTRPFPAQGQTNLVPGFQRKPTDDPNVEDLLLQLEEIQTGMVTFGGGYSTSFGPSVFASVSEKNLFGYGVSGTLSGEYGEWRNRFSLELKEPHFLGSDFSTEWDIYYVDQEGYGGRSFNEKRIGSSVLFGYELDKQLSLLFGVKGENTDLSPDSRHRWALDPTSIPKEFDLGKNTTTSLTVGFVHDLRDFTLDPRNGTYLRSTVELAGITDNEFVKWKNTGHYYKELHEKLILALGTEVDMAYAYGDPGFIPLQERFFIGGARTIRGFDEGGIGNYAAIRYLDKNLGGYRSYLGGEAAWVNNIELRYSLSEIFQAVYFVDAGTSWPEIGDFDISEFRVSTGLGLRVRIPGLNATLRLDFPYVVRKFKEDDTEFFHFSFGQTF